MAFSYHHLEKWVFANIDLIEEKEESFPKAIVLIAGASSSGKSYSAQVLYEELLRRGKHPVIISLDQYNIGLSGIIPNKVNENYFDNSLKNIKEISKAIKPIIYDVPFDQKYSPAIIDRLRPVLTQLLPEESLETFLMALHREWLNVNFDEPTVYDLKEASDDIRELYADGTIDEKKYSKVVSERVPSDRMIQGKNHDVIIVEGIYSLSPNFVRLLDGLPYITNFIDGSPKSLFLRRIIRDKVTTSADSVFTIRLYFKYIVKAYNETILPCREIADVILDNEMTFGELRAGTLYLTKDIIFTEDKALLDDLMAHSEVVYQEYQRDIYFNAVNENQTYNNILRLREISHDGGKTYVPSSLVHKGSPKVRLDKKNIRPINILLNEEELPQVWTDETEALNDFRYAGFVIGDIENKIKTKICYRGKRMNIRYIENKGHFIEFDPPYDDNVTVGIKARARLRQATGSSAEIKSLS